MSLDQMVNYSSVADSPQVRKQAAQEIPVGSGRENAGVESLAKLGQACCFGRGKLR
ncbi:hypothetical protein [Modicisalibacter luteus]|uniref:Uncharacterized protein n=1 Tax=Modicisalibacter luteus TaxID=453962 RepID=A0ABV7M5M7_9GAMM|nr:hypothetical protein [Halomonas lutea]GHA84823.1 hypothetical protein GCM10007159_02370 [Halomonas lutea]